MNLYECCEFYLSQKRHTLWGQAFNIGPEGDMEQAAAWLYAQMSAVLDMWNAQETS